MRTYQANEISLVKTCAPSWKSTNCFGKLTVKIHVELNEITMKNFIVGFLFVAAIFFPILFIPLFVVALVATLIVSPHVHDMWSEPKH